MTKTRTPCYSCKWAKFKMTEHDPPRIQENKFGVCLYPIPTLPVLPMCVYPVPVVKGTIWPTTPIVEQPGECDTWEAR